MNHTKVDIKCGDIINGSITEKSQLPWNKYEFKLSECEFERVIFTTCTNDTIGFNTILKVFDDGDNVWINDDAIDNGYECDMNYFASSISLSNDDLICNETYMITVSGKYQKESFGQYGLAVICGQTVFDV